MAVTLGASKQGLQKIDLARKKKGWQATAVSWYKAAHTSAATLKRFRQGKPIDRDVFIAICKAVGIENWEDIVEKSTTEPFETSQVAQVQWVLVLSGTIEDNDKVKADLILSQLEPLIKESNLTIQRFEAAEGNWKPVSEVFKTATKTPAFRLNAVQQAKQIQLGDRTLALLLDIASSERQETSVLLGIYPVDRQIYLPEALNFIIFSESGETLVEIEAKSDSQGIVQELFLQPAEHFSLEVSLNEFRITEDFAI